MKGNSKQWKVIEEERQDRCEGRRTVVREGER